VTPAGGERDSDSDSEPFGALPEEPGDDGGQDLEAGDDLEFDDELPDGGPSSALPQKVEAWRKRSATGAILTGFALGLQQVFEKEKEQPAIVMQTSGDPPTDLPVEADVEHGRPRQSVVNIRPWLLGGAGEADDAGEPSDPGTAADVRPQPGPSGEGAGATPPDTGSQDA
jgi:hypothetical protein